MSFRFREINHKVGYMFPEAKARGSWSYDFDVYDEDWAVYVHHFYLDEEFSVCICLIQNQDFTGPIDNRLRARLVTRRARSCYNCIHRKPGCSILKRKTNRCYRGRRILW